MNPAIGYSVKMGLLASIFAFAMAPIAQAAKPCSNATLKGTYGAQIKGTASGLPFAALDDVVTADGKGNFSGTGTIAYNGVILQNVPISATYAIGPTCSGTVNFSTGATQNLLITTDGSEVQFIRTDDVNDQVTGDAKRSDAQSCSNRSLQGHFGATLGGDVSGLPFVALDQVAADGSGNFSGTGTFSYNGTIAATSFTATYTINSNCSGSIVFDNGVTQDLVVVGKGSEVRFIRTDNADAVVSGAAKRLVN